MAEPLDHQIVEKLAELLREVLVANDYRTDAGEHVFTEEVHDTLPDNVCVVQVLDADEELLDQQCTHRKAALNLRVETLLPFTLAGGARRHARRVLADQRRALSKASKDFLPGVTRLALGGRRIEPRELPGPVNQRQEWSGHLVAVLDVRAELFETHT